MMTNLICKPNTPSCIWLFILYFFFYSCLFGVSNAFAYTWR